jgi:hypothetical protein
MKYLAVLGSLLVVLTLSGCGSTRAIGDVLADPSQYSGDRVRVEGRVVESYSLLGQGAYRIEDDTGRLWVVSRTGVPNPGARVSVEGQVQQSFNLGGIIALPGSFGSGTVMLESSHDTRSGRP